MSLAHCSILWYSCSQVVLFFKIKSSSCPREMYAAKVHHQTLVRHERRSCATFAAAWQSSVCLLSSCQTPRVPTAEKRGGAPREAVKTRKTRNKPCSPTAGLCICCRSSHACCSSRARETVLRRETRHSAQTLAIQLRFAFATGQVRVKESLCTSSKQRRGGVFLECL